MTGAGIKKRVHSLAEIGLDRPRPTTASSVGQSHRLLADLSEFGRDFGGGLIRRWRWAGEVGGVGDFVGIFRGWLS